MTRILLSRKREPGWCDRILFNGANINQLFYESILSVTQSDHRPVCSLLQIPIYKENPEKDKVFNEEILEKIKQIKEMVPKSNLSRNKIIFEKLKSETDLIEELEISNIGEGALEFNIIEKESESRKWLSANPRTGVVFKGKIV